MGLLDKGFSLPGIGEAASSITNTVSSSVSFAVSSATTKISEVVGSTISAFGADGGPFSKIGANTPTFDQMKTAAMRAGSILVGGSGELVKSQIAAEAESLFATASASAIKAAAGVSGNVTDHFVTLTEIRDPVMQVQFDVMPQITEARVVQYEAVAPVQFPGAFQKYKGTDSTTWTLDAMFVARNSEEANTNLYYLNLLRGWTMSFFGENTAAAYHGALGAPPPVLNFFGLRNLVGTVPVVITSLNWNFPKDVDYLPTRSRGEDGNIIPFPAVMNVAIQLTESFSTTQFNQFSLSDYRRGDMKNAYGRAIAELPSEVASPAPVDENDGSYDRLEARRLNLPAPMGGQSSNEFAARDPRRFDLNGGPGPTKSLAEQQREEDALTK